MVNRFGNILLIPIICLLLSNCAMRSLHNRSIVNLRNETAHNYSKQVVEAAAGILDRSELPVMLSIEGGNSIWNPRYEKNLSASISPPWSAGNTVLNPGVVTSESIVDTMQFNDFGSDATYRLHILYTYLCFPLVIENLYMPNGMLYSIFTIQDTQNGLDYPTKLREGNYIGVPKEKKREFLFFVSDVLNWSRHASPNILDLSSPPGITYMFFFKYYYNLQTGYSSNHDALVLKNEIQQQKTQADKIKEDYQSKLQFALENNSTNNSFIPALQLLQNDVETMRSELSSQYNSLRVTQSNVQQTYVENHFILNKLKRALKHLAEQDPNINIQEVNDTLDALTKRIEDVHEGKSNDLTEALKHLIPIGGSGIEAAESTEELYRERFERLPDTIDTSSIRLN